MEANARPGSDTITVPAGVYVLGITGRDEDQGATGDLDVTNDLTLHGAGSAGTIVDANLLDRAFHFLSGDVTVSGMTVQNGRAPRNSGGGIRNETRMTASDLIVTDNEAEFGGGLISGSRAVVTMMNVEVRRNRADFGGGISSIGPVVFRNLSVQDNSAAFNGGGLHFFSCGSATIVDSTLSGNHAGDRGGGIIVGSGVCPGEREALTLTNVTISGNRASRGGGLWLSTTPATAATTSVRLVNSTVVENDGARGGGLANVDQFDSFGTLTVRNSIVARNVRGGDCAGRLTSEGGNLASDTTCPFTGRNDRQATDPRIGPLAQNGGRTRTHALLPGSPAIDAGVAPCPPADQRGVERSAGPSGACDSGAFEVAVDAGPAPQPRRSDDEDEDEKKLTDEQRQQRQRTNRSGRDDYHSEGNVVGVALEADDPYALIATRDGVQRVVLRCGRDCPAIHVGDYLEAEGEKVHEELFEASEVSVSRPR
jgi:hypothetical protein